MNCHEKKEIKALSLCVTCYQQHKRERFPNVSEKLFHSSAWNLRDLI